MFSYDKESKTITIERREYHCVRVVNGDVGGEITPLAHNEPVGSRKIELDLSPDGNKAIMKTNFGEKKFNVAPSVDELNRVIVGFERGRFVVGELKHGLKDGKDGLIEYLEQEGSDKVNPNSDIAMGRLELIISSVAVKSKLLPDECDMINELHSLMERDDFEFDKDYTYLYQNDLLLKCKVGANVYEAYGQLSNNDSVFDASDVIVFRDGREIKDFGETWVGTSEDANDFYHAMLCAYLNHDEEFKDFLACSEIQNFKAKEQEQEKPIPELKNKYMLSGLREILRRFDKKGTSAKQGKWSIGKGGYDKNFEIYYENIPVLECVPSGRGFGSYEESMLVPIGDTEKNLKNVLRVIKEEYGLYTENELKKLESQLDNAAKSFSSDTLPQSKGYSR